MRDESCIYFTAEKKSQVAPSLQFRLQDVKTFFRDSSSINIQNGLFDIDIASTNFD
jgi:hypothetical protein